MADRILGGRAPERIAPTIPDRRDRLAVNGFVQEPDDVDYKPPF